MKDIAQGRIRQAPLSEFTQAPLEIASPDGVVLRGARFGQPDSPVVVLLHGGGQTRHAWTDTAHLLAASGFCAVSLDARGHGDSDWCPRGDYSADALVRDLRAILGSFSSPPYLVGASMGGLTALLTLGEDHTLDCRGLVLVDVAARLESDGVRRIIDFMRQHTAGFESLEQARDAVNAYNPTRKASASPAGLLKNLRHAPDGRLFWHWDPAFLGDVSMEGSGKGMFDPARLDGAAARLTLPVLLIRGFHSDVLSEEGARDLLARIPQARYQVVEQAGHMVVGDRNNAFTHAVLEFLNHAGDTSSANT